MTFNESPSFDFSVGNHLPIRIEQRFPRLQLVLRLFLLDFLFASLLPVSLATLISLGLYLLADQAWETPQFQALVGAVFVGLWVYFTLPHIASTLWRIVLSRVDVEIRAGSVVYRIHFPWKIFRFEKNFEEFEGVELQFENTFQIVLKHRHNFLWNILVAQSLYGTGFGHKIHEFARVLRIPLIPIEDQVMEELESAEVQRHDLIQSLRARSREDMQRSHPNDPAYAVAQPERFSHLDLQFYEQIAEILEHRGFERFGDFESQALNKNYPQTRSFFRAWKGMNDSVTSLCYQVIQDAGLLGETTRLRVIEFISKFTDGKILITSIDNPSAHLLQPDGVLCDYLPVTASTDDVLLRHLARIHALKAKQPTLEMTLIPRAEDFLTLLNELHTRKIKFRESLGNRLTEEEIESMMKKSTSDRMQ